MLVLILKSNLGKRWWCVVGLMILKIRRNSNTNGVFLAKSLSDCRNQNDPINSTKLYSAISCAEELVGSDAVNHSRIV